jgi:hypothetical protein
MARRKPRTRQAELLEHERLASACVEILTALVALEPNVPDFMYARKVVLDGRALLEQERQALATAPVPSGTEG